MKYLIGLFFILLCAVCYFAYKDHIAWIAYAKENNCAATGKQNMSTYIYFINVNNQLLPQQGITISNEFFCTKNNEIIWR